MPENVQPSLTLSNTNTFTAPSLIPSSTVRVVEAFSFLGRNYNGGGWISLTNFDDEKKIVEARQVVIQFGNARTRILDH